MASEIVIPNTNKRGLNTSGSGSDSGVSPTSKIQKKSPKKIKQNYEKFLSLCSQSDRTLPGPLYSSPDGRHRSSSQSRVRIPATDVVFVEPPKPPRKVTNSMLASSIDKILHQVTDLSQKVNTIDGRLTKTEALEITVQSIKADQQKLQSAVSALKANASEEFRLLRERLDKLEHDKASKEDVARIAHEANANREGVAKVSEQLEIVKACPADPNSAQFRKDILDRNDAHEQYSRRESMRLINLPDYSRDGETLHETFLRMCEVIDADVRPYDISVIHRAGRNLANRPRHVLVRFVTRKAIVELQSKKSRLRQTSEFPRVIINEDLTRTRARLFAICRHADSVRRASPVNGRILCELVPQTGQRYGQTVRVEKISDLEGIGVDPSTFDTWTLPSRTQQDQSRPRRNSQREHPAIAHPSQAYSHALTRSQSQPDMPSSTPMQYANYLFDY